MRPARRILLVVHALPSESPGGTEGYAWRLARACAAAGDEVSVLTGSMSARPKAALASGEEEGMRVHRLFRTGLFLDGWERGYDPVAEHLFRRLLREEQPHVVHVHHWLRLTRTLVRAAREEGIPAVLTLHDLISTCPRCFRVREDGFCTRDFAPENCVPCAPRPAWLGEGEAALEVLWAREDFGRELDAASFRIVPSEAHARALALFTGRPRLDFEVLPHGPLHDLRRGRRRARKAQGPVELVHFGHLHPVKGLHVLLEAMRLLEPTDRDRIRLTVLGEPIDAAYRARLLELAQDLPVLWRGPYRPDDLARLDFDWAVFPSLAHESHSFVLDEAFARGWPVLASDRGALAERVGAAGLLAPTGDPEGWAEVLRALLGDPGLARAARRRVPKARGFEEHATRVRGLHERAIQEAPPRLEPDRSLEARRLEHLDRMKEALVERVRALQGRQEQLLDQVAGLQREIESAGLSVAAERDRRSAAAAWAEAIARRMGAEVRPGSGLDANLTEIERSVGLQRAQRDALEAAVRGAEARSALLSGVVASQEAEAGVRNRRLAEALAETSELARALERAEGALRAREEERDGLVRTLAEVEERAAATLEHLRAREEERDGLVRTLAEVEGRAAAEIAQLRAESERLLQGWDQELRRSALRARQAGEAVQALGGLRHSLAEAEARESEATARLAALGVERQLLARRLWRRTLAPAPARAPGGGARGEAPEPSLEELRKSVADLTALASRLEAENEALRRRESTPAATTVTRERHEAGSRLRVLMVIHDFLPRHAAGSEIYTWRLARELSRDHEVTILCTEAHPGVHSYRVRDTEYDGLPVIEVSHQHTTPWFELTWRDPRMNAIFEEVLDRVRPDVVHLQHLLHHSIDYPALARRRGCPVVFTLHEYHVLCPRGGQMLRPGLERCEEPVPELCAECIGHLRLGSSPEEAGRAPWTARVGRHLPPRVKQAIRAALRPEAAPPAATGPAPLADRARAVSARLQAMREALRHVDLFLAPSRFLARTVARSGVIPEDRIEVSDNGQDLSRFEGLVRVPSPTLRVGYVGTIAEYKGVHVLVDAANSLEDRSDIAFHIHGSLATDPAYAQDLVHRARSPSIRFHGACAPDEVARVFAALDVLVVPSLWWENSPLTIHEAYLAGIPVVASDIGGMAEYVEPGRTGLLFRVGDAEDLAAKLRLLEPGGELLAALSEAKPAIKSIAEDAASMVQRYRRLLAARGDPR